MEVSGWIFTSATYRLTSSVLFSMLISVKPGRRIGGEVETTKSEIFVSFGSRRQSSTLNAKLFLIFVSSIREKLYALGWKSTLKELGGRLTYDFYDLKEVSQAKPLTDRSEPYALLHMRQVLMRVFSLE
jgi:hypothetical protein